MEKCKYCQSDKLYLEPKNPGEDIATANMVALKCKDCGMWLKWVKKSDRAHYLGQFSDTLKEPLTPQMVREEALTKKGVDELINLEPKNDTIEQQNKLECTNYATQVLISLRRQLLSKQVYYRSDVIGAIDDKIREIKENG